MEPMFQIVFLAFSEHEVKLTVNIEIPQHTLEIFPIWVFCVMEFNGIAHSLLRHHSQTPQELARVMCLHNILTLPLAC